LYELEKYVAYITAVYESTAIDTKSLELPYVVPTITLTVPLFGDILIILPLLLPLIGPLSATYTTPVILLTVMPYG